MEQKRGRVGTRGLPKRMSYLLAPGRKNTSHPCLGQGRGRNVQEGCNQLRSRRTLSSHPPVTSSPPYAVTQSGRAETGNQTCGIWGRQCCLAPRRGQVPIARHSAWPLPCAHAWEVRKDPERPRVAEEGRLKEKKKER